MKKEFSAIFMRITKEMKETTITFNEKSNLIDIYTCNAERRERILLNLSIENRIDRFITLAEKYTNIRELTPEILRTFIAKIVIHERPVKWKNDGE